MAWACRLSAGLSRSWAGRWGLKAKGRTGRGVFLVLPCRRGKPFDDDTRHPECAAYRRVPRVIIGFISFPPVLTSRCSFIIMKRNEYQLQLVTDGPLLS